MMKRLWWVGLILLLGALPVAAQDTTSSPVDWIPADFAGFVRFSMADANVTLQDVNMAARMTAILQPSRFTLPPQPHAYEDILLLRDLFDVEDVSFAQDIFDWLDGDVVVAYRQFDGPLSVAPGDTLLILPATDMLLAASRLSRIIEGQDLAQRSSYQDVTLYIGDKATFALTTQAVFVGSTEVVQAALDLQAGEGERLTDQPAYRAIASAVPQDAVAFGYMDGEGTASVLNLLLTGQQATDPLLDVFGEVLRQVRGENALETRLVTGNVGGVGFVLQPVSRRPAIVSATVLVASDDGSAQTAAAELDPTLLDLIPRNAMIVNHGADIHAAADSLLAALPFANFGGRILAGFPVNESAGSQTGLIQDPTAEDAQTAIANFLTTLDAIGDYNLQADFLDHLSGAYLLAVLPTPNRPVAFLNTPFEMLLIAPVEDDEAALEGATRLVELALGVQDAPTETIGDYEFTSIRLQATGDPVIRMGIVDGALMVGTGAAIEQALAAQRGDNRLTNEERWQIFTPDDAPMPDLYMDLILLYNTFIPSAGGLVTTSDFRVGLAADTDYLGNGVYQIDVRISLPG